MQEKTERFWKKIWQPKKQYIRKGEWINTISKDVDGLEEGSKVDILIDLLKTTLNIYQTGKSPAIMEYMGSGSRNQPPFTRPSFRNEQMFTWSTSALMVDQKIPH